jgi:type I restriction enzyme S subunit
MSFPRYESYKDSGVEWLEGVPEHWEVKALKQVCDVFPSNVDKKTQENEPPVRLCNYTDVYYNEQITQHIDFMAATASADQIKKFTLRTGDTIITKDSETADDIAIAAYVPKDLPGVICGYHLSIVRPYESTYGAFIKRLFDSVYVKSCCAVSANGLTRIGLGQYALDNMKMAFPPKLEQQTIATFLDRETAKIDALIAEQQRLIELLKEKRQAVISQAVTKGLNPDAPMKDSGIEWLGEVPGHWSVKQLRHIAKIVRGASPRPAGDPKFFSTENFDGNNTPWVTVADITKDVTPYITDVSEFLTPLGVKNSQFFGNGTLVFSNSGATLGVPKILSVNCCANDGVLAFRDLSNEVNILFAYHFLLTTTERLRTEMKQGGGQPNLNVDIVKNIGFAVPPLSEQSTIVAFLDNETTKLDILTAEAKASITLLKERRTALISVAVTGKIDVRNAA